MNMNCNHASIFDAQMTDSGKNLFNKFTHWEKKKIFLTMF